MYCLTLKTYSVYQPEGADCDLTLLLAHPALGSFLRPRNMLYTLESFQILANRSEVAQWLGYVEEVHKKYIKFKLIFLPSCFILI